MKRIVPALSLLALLAARPVRAGEPGALGPERVVFHTVAGDLVFALYPDAAPQTVRQFLRLVRGGVYDTTAFTRIHPGFIAQVSTAQDRAQPLSAEQAALLRPVPLEAGSLEHVRGALSLSHASGSPDGGETSFCILLDKAPQLDGRYTVFGRLDRGEDVLAELLRVPRTAQMAPLVRLTITRAEVFDSPAALDRARLAPAHAVAGVAQAAAAAEAGPREGLLASGLALIILLAGAAALLRQRAPRLVGSLNLIAVLVASFLLLVLLLPEGQRRPLLGALLFFGLVGVFKALGSFETALERPQPALRRLLTAPAERRGSTAAQGSVPQ